MTGYTVHTGTTVKFAGGWDRIFGGGKSAKSLKSTAKKSGKKSAKKTVAKSVKHATTKGSIPTKKSSQKKR